MKELEEFITSIITEFEAEGRYGTAHIYDCACKTFKCYWQTISNKTIMSCNKVFAKPVLSGYETYLHNRKLSKNTISTYIRILRAIYYRALNYGFVSYIPGLFSHLYTGICFPVKRSLPASVMGKMLVSKKKFDEKLEKIQSYFLLLFLLRGMPFADLVRLKKNDLKGDTIIYRRQKTGKVMMIKLPDQARELIVKHRDNCPGSQYLLDIMIGKGKNVSFGSGTREEYNSYQRRLRYFNRNLKLLSVEMGIKEPISSYTARHTWATTAYYRKYSIGIISNALGHSDIKVTESYLKPFDNMELDTVNESIISYVKGRATVR